MKAVLVMPDGTRKELGGLSQFAQATEPGQGLFLLPGGSWLSVDLGPGQHRAQWMPVGGDGEGPVDLELRATHMASLEPDTDSLVGQDLVGGVDGEFSGELLPCFVAYLPSGLRVAVLP